MAKQKTGGPVRYHNLAGFMRDLRKALDNGDQEGYELAELLIECDDLVIGDGDDAEDGVDDASDGDTPAVAGAGREERVPAAGPTGGPAARVRARGTAASALDRALDGLAGKERSEAIAELDALRMHSMGAPRVAGLEPRSGAK